MTHPEPTSRRTIRFPLSLLFVLMTICAVLAGMNASLLTSRGKEQLPNWTQVLGAGLGGAALGMLLGLCVGLTHHRRLLGALLGIAVGAVVGFVVGPLMMVPLQGYPALFLASAVGAALIVAAGIYMRLSTI